MKHIYRFVATILVALVLFAYSIPLTAAAAPLTQGELAGCQQFYVVRSGDTLARIAARFGTTVSQLVALNGLTDPNIIHTGTQLCVPPASYQPATGNLATVTSSALNVRSGPNTRYPAFTAVLRGTRLNIVGQDAGGNWLLVQLPDGNQGWVYRWLTDYRTTAAVVSLPPLTASYAISDFTGWRGEYFNNPHLAGYPTLVRDDAHVFFDSGTSALAFGLPADRFSARWSRSLRFEEGRYRFYLVMDDGARLFIDGERVIDQWRDGSRREVTVERYLAGGNHSLQVEYYENSGEALIKLWWEKVPAPAPKPVFHGWKAEYWSNSQLKGDPMFVVDNGEIDFRWGEWVPLVGLPTDHFSARWSRQMQFASGRYRLNARADDGIRVYVDGKRVLDRWHESPGYETYAVELELAGEHNLVVEYYENRGVALVKFWWERLG
jgi:hypothetical protein